MVVYNGVEMIEGWPERISEAQSQATYLIGGHVYDRVPYGSEGDGWGRKGSHAATVPSSRGSFTCQAAMLNDVRVVEGRPSRATVLIKKTSKSWWLRIAFFRSWTSSRLLQKYRPSRPSHSQVDHKHHQPRAEQPVPQEHRS